MNAATESNGVVMIAHERERQMTDKGFDATRDDEYRAQQLVYAAIHYAHPDNTPTNDFWPRDWAPRWDQKYDDDRVTQLAKAGALIAAEIDRLLRIPTAPTVEEAFTARSNEPIWTEGGDGSPLPDSPS